MKTSGLILCEATAGEVAELLCVRETYMSTVGLDKRFDFI